MTHEETLRQWLDGDLGGTMPPEATATANGLR